MRKGFSETVRSFLLPIVVFLDDPGVTEIMINKSDEIWIERNGKVEKTEAGFNSEDDLMSAVNNISQYVDRRIDPETPYLDARLPDGSRIHVILPPCARKGVCVAIRKFSKDPLTVQNLLESESLSQAAVTFLQGCVHAKKNILISGGTGSGKTSLLNAISSHISNDERIIVIEDSAELQLQQDHVLLLETRMADRLGKGRVDIRDLLRSTLRLRPDRIIIGEIRGGEALDLLQAMNTGHGGSMGTIHANSSLDALFRLETLTLFSGIELPLKAIRAQIASAIDIIIQTTRYHDGSRKVAHISENLSLGSDGNYQVQDIFRFNPLGHSTEGRILGVIEPCGIVPECMQSITLSGYKLSQDLFSTAPTAK